MAGISINTVWKRRIWRFLKITGIAAGSILFLMFLFPYIFPGFIARQIKQWARNSIQSELNFSDASLSFFKHFPALTLTLSDFSVNGSAPFENEVLVSSKEISLGVDLTSLFASSISVDKIFLNGATINIQVDEEGHANYNIYQSSDSATTTTGSDSTSASLKIEKILIENSSLTYKDASLPMLLSARGLYYEGTGDLSKAIFDLHTHTEIDSLDFYYDQQPYFLSKKINADLVTKINTHSLALLFEKNRLYINRLPVNFTGSLEFLPGGYVIDCSLKSADSDLHDMFTALPPDVLDWLQHTTVKGFGSLDATFKGKYIPAENSQPDLAVNLKIRQGSIANQQAPAPLKNIFLDLHAGMPKLNMDSLYVNIDSLAMAMDKDFFYGRMHWKGWSQPVIHTRLNAALDLERWSRAMGVSGFAVKGRYVLHAQADGKYATTIVPDGIRKMDTVISSIPRFELRSSVTDGYFKYTALPQAVRDISFNLDASCPDSNYKNTRLSVENLRAKVLDNYVRGFFRLTNTDDFPIDANLQTVFNLADIKQFYPLDSINLAGDLKVDIQTKGNYVPARHLFPVTHALLELKNGRIQTPYYPKPLEQVQVAAELTSDKGSLRDLHVACTPISFQFEGQPFMVKADLQNFDDLRYNITSHGTLDIGKLYRVFALQGYDLQGFVETNLSLRGRQSDATAGRYDRLYNRGSMKVKDVAFRSDLFPQPFLVHTGLFRFDEDKMWFDAFRMSYGKTKLSLDGYLSNVIDYFTTRQAPLKGAFDLKSDYVLVDEFMAYAGDTTDHATATDSAGTGVFIVPPDLSLSLKAAVKKTRFSGMDINDLSGQVVIDSGKIKLQQTGFTLIDAPVMMDAEYQSLSPRRAQFTYHINAKEFDVKKAYNEIKLFHDLASSASRAEGVISLDYQLAGRLDENMHPVYPSLKGGGVLSIKKVKVKGLKLFNVVSRKTEKDIRDPDLSKVNIKSTIAKNIIHIARTRMRVSVFRLRLEGEADFYGHLNLGMRIGLPPLGLIGIPVKITGTQNNPVIKAGKARKDQLEEVEDTEEEVPPAGNQ